MDKKTFKSEPQETITKVTYNVLQILTLGPYEISVVERNGKLSLNFELRGNSMRVSTLFNIFSDLTSEARVDLYNILSDPKNYKDQEVAGENIEILRDLKDDLLSDEKVF
jgi:hypothetical protein